MKKCANCSSQKHFHEFIVVGDELFSDTYPMKLVDDCIYEVYGKVRLGLGEPILIISCDKLMMRGLVHMLKFGSVIILAFNSDFVNQVPSRIFNDTIDFLLINETVLAYGSIIERSHNYDQRVFWRRVRRLSQLVSNLQR